MPTITARPRLRPRADRELLLLAALYVCYSLARLAADDDVARAVTNAHRLLGVEAVVHLDVERWLNALVSGLPLLALLASYWYAALHYVVTPAVLVWVYRRHPGHYRRARTALVVATGLGLVGFVLLPTAPPRMLPGFVDTLAGTAGQGWWAGDASAPKGLGGLTNELAAMPSLHVGWALWCAWVVLLAGRRRWLRVLAVAYAAGTVLVVVGTANHYVLDAAGGAAVLAVGVLVTSVAARRAQAGKRTSGAASTAPVCSRQYRSAISSTSRACGPLSTPSIVTVLTRSPGPATSLCRDRARLRSPALATPTAAALVDARSAATEPVRITVPRPASRIAGTASWTATRAPTTPTSRASRRASGVRAVTGPSTYAEPL
jgi:hypothetical protein